MQTPITNKSAGNLMVPNKKVSRVSNYKAPHGSDNETPPMLERQSKTINISTFKNLENKILEVIDDIARIDFNLQNLQYQSALIDRSSLRIHLT